MTPNPHMHKVQFYETDAMGIVHHSNYIRWFEESRVDFMDQVGYGYERVNAMGLDFPVIEVKCQYKSMVRFGDTVQIFPSLIEFSPAKMTIAYRVINIHSGVLCTTGETHHYVYNTARKRIVSLEKEIPELFTLFSDMVTTQA